jgi:hypothetical protein
MKNASAQTTIRTFTTNMNQPFQAVISRSSFESLVVLIDMGCSLATDICAISYRFHVEGQCRAVMSNRRLAGGGWSASKRQSAQAAAGGDGA